METKQRMHHPPASQPPTAAPLVAHGLEFIDRAVELLSREPATERDARDAIVLLAIGIELLLKARLMAEHWSLVFEKIDEADIDKLCAGDFRSAKTDQYLERLVKICKIKFSDRTRNTFKKLSEDRNRMVHFAVTISAQSLRVRAFAALSELVDFVARECSLSEEALVLQRKIERQLLSVKEYVSKRLYMLSDDISRLADGGYPCPSCDQRTVDVASEECRCIFCNESQFYGEVSSLHMTRTLRRTEADFRELGNAMASCNACEGWTSVVLIRDGADAMRCVSCGREISQPDLVHCTKCNHWNAAAPGLPAQCADCGTPSAA